MDEEQLKSELQREYSLRFSAQQQYRNEVWKILTSEFFQTFISPASQVLDLGCGWGEFINHIKAAKKYAMDLNPECRERLESDVEFLEQNCAKTWQLADGTLTSVFTSNFFEHLRTKDDLRDTLTEVRRCLRPDGTLICMGPNIKYLPGAYWDFWDHYLPLTELSLREILELLDFRVELCVSRFLPYTMAQGWQPPPAFVRFYIKMPLLWKMFGKQFLIVARANKPS